MREPFIRLLAALARPIYGGVGCILCLHRVITDSERSSFPNHRALELTPDDLREILAWVRERKLDVVSLDAVPARLRRPTRRKFVVFTFDDGYRDNLTHALPIFRELGMPFAVNITTRFVSGDSYPWWYALEDVLVGRERLIFSWEGRDMNLWCGSPEAREQALDQLSALVRSLAPDPRRTFLEIVFNAAEMDPAPRVRRLMLSWAEVRELSREPLVTIGAHSAEHSALSCLNAGQARAELASGKSELEAQIGREVRHLAYPFGGRNAVGEREFGLATECGFETAVTTRSANLFPQHAQMLDRLPRLGISGNYLVIPRLRKLESGLLPAAEHRGRRVIGA